MPLHNHLKSRDSLVLCFNEVSRKSSQGIKGPIETPVEACSPLFCLRMDYSSQQNIIQILYQVIRMMSQ